MYLKSTIVVALALLLVAGIGVAYAMWSEVLRVNVYVNTGEVDVKWSDWWTNDTEEKTGLDVTKVYISPEEYDDEGDIIKLNVTIDNAYPCYAVEIHLLVDNIGTIPVDLLGYGITGVNTTALDVQLILPEDTQIDPGGASEYVLIIHVLQGADENSTYTFDVTLTFAQWNEVPAPT